MKKSIVPGAIVALFLTTPLFAGEPITTSGKAPAVDTSIDPHQDLWDPHRPDSHAPIGVMGDHTHEAGEFMFSYRWMYMSMDGHRSGTESLTSKEVFHRGFGAAATQMDMHMHMFGMMFAPTDELTLMAMANYVESDMELLANPHAAHGHGGHGGGHTGSFGHSSQGLGDVTVGALYKIYDANNQRVHFNLGLVLPTAEVDKKQHGAFLPYGMQLGSGTWDLKPGLTYLGQSGALSWGAQAIATWRLEDENESGFSYGDGVNLTPWVALRLSDSLSVSGRLNYSYYEDIDGHYNGPHNHTAPPHFQENYGGHILEAGLGLNFLVPDGPLKGHRLAVEGLMPLYQDMNGVGMDREYMIVVGWQKAF